MSGHSKWANIRVKKTAQDARRGKVFTRHARLIEIAARAGGGDPGTNSTLRTAIENAKADSVPAANIERAIKKGTGEAKGEAMQEVVYEAYGAAGTAYIIECLTDNRNRTIANVKSIVNKHGGRMAESGSVAWMFERKGVVVAEQVGESGGSKQAISDKRLAVSQSQLEELELELIDFGAEDLSVEEGVLHVVTGVADWSKIRDFLVQNGWKILSAGLSYLPKQKIEVKDEAMAKKVTDFVEAIEEDDDVSEVHTNAVLP